MLLLSMILCYVINTYLYIYIYYIKIKQYFIIDLSSKRLKEILKNIKIK